MKNAGTSILILCGLAVIGMGVQGMCVSRCKNRLFIMCFGCGLGTIAIILFIFGGMFASTASWFPNWMDAMCTPKQQSSGAPYLKSSSVDTGMMKLVNENMCTAKCPCDPATYNSGYSSVPDSTFTYNGRQKANMVMATGGGKNYKNFKSCWVDTLQAAQTDQQQVGAINAYMASMGAMEQKFSCSGFCK